MLDKDVSEILRVVEGSRPDVWGRGARQMADGIERSGLIASVDGLNRDVHTGLTEIAAILGITAGRISAAITENSRLMAEIDSAIRAPRQTAAAERFSMGIKALSHGWDEEAIEELTAAIELDRFHAPSHMSLGHAFARTGRFTEAAGQFALSLRYSMPEDPAFGAASAIQQAVSLESGGEPEAAVTALSGARELFPTCSDLWLLLARMTGDREVLREALRISPELSLVAVAASIEGAEEVSTEVGTADDGPLVLVREVRDALDALVQLFPRDAPIDMPQRQFETTIVGQEALDELGRHETAASASEEMLTASDVLDAVDRCLSGIEERASRTVADLESDAASAQPALMGDAIKRAAVARENARVRRNAAIRERRLTPSLVRERRELLARDDDPAGLARVEAALEAENQVINQQVKVRSKSIESELAGELAAIDTDIEQRLEAISDYRNRVPRAEEIAASIESIRAIAAKRSRRLRPWG